MELLSQANGEWLPMGAAASMIGVSRQALFKVAPKLLCAGAAYQRCNGRWMFCRSTVVDAYRDQTRPRSDSPIERDHRWMNGTDAARFLQISYSSLSSQYYSRLIDAGVARRNRSGQVLFLRSQALATALDAARDARRADIAARRADASIQRRRHLACVAAADTGDQWRTRIDFAGMVFPLLASKEKWILGTICVHGHTWPGTCLSLRRVYNGQVANCVECRSVHDGADRLWWLRFVDWPSSPLPKGLRLGRLCPARHDWMSTGLSLREGGKCPECEKIRQSSPERLAAHRAWYAQKRLDPQWVAKERRRSVQKWRSCSAEQKAKKNQCNARRRAAFKAQGLTTNGTVPVLTSPEETALLRWLRKPLLSASVMDLVMQQQRRHWKECPSDRRDSDRAIAKHRFQLRYLCDSAFREYHAAKARAWKARNPGKNRDGARQYYHDNKERCKMLCREWRQNNKEKVRELGRRSKARRRMANRLSLVPLTLASKQSRFAIWRGHCAYCGFKLRPSHLGHHPRAATVDHVMPVVNGGLDESCNVVPACWTCNTTKNASPMEEWYRAQPFFSEARLAKIRRHTSTHGGQLSLVVA
jgi:hypothetical protein